MRFKMWRGWVIVGFFVLHVVDVRPYELKLYPETPLVQRSVGTNLLLTCKAGDTPNDSLIMWFDNNNTRVTKLVDKSNDTAVGLYIVGEEPKLLLRNMKKYYDGTYTCKLLVNGSIVKEESRKVELYEEFAFSHVPLKQYLAVGREGLVVCEPKPGVEVKWKKDMAPVTQDDRYGFIQEGLTIKNVQFSDAGYYLCEIQRDDPYLYQVQEIQVEVHVPVKITKEIGNNTGVEGADFSLTCKASGDPAATFRFYFGGQILENSSRINVDEERGQVFFAPLRREDEGQVSCSALNTVSVENSTGYLTVQISPAVLSFQNQTFKEGEDAVIQCSTEGKPTPIVVIKKLNNSTYQSNRGTLNISRITSQAAGLYYCEAYSLLGSDSVTSRIDVKFKPRPLPNQKIRWTTFVFIKRNMTCEVEAFPLPSFKWFFSGVELTDNETFRIFSSGTVSHLQIYIDWKDQAWVYGTYTSPSNVTCRSSNSEGSVDVRMTLSRSGTPSELENVTFSIHPCQVDFYFSPPYDLGDEPLEWVVADVFFNESRKFPWGNQFKLRSLKPNTYYEVRLCAASAAGQGEIVDVEFTTLPPSVPSPIQLDRSKDVMGVSLYHVEWEEPVDTCHPVTKFKIRYRKMKVHGDSRIMTPMDGEWKKMVLEGSARSLDLTGLSADSYYLLEVLPENKLGSPKHSGFAVIKTSSGSSQDGKGPVIGGSPVRRLKIRSEALVAIVVSLLLLFLVLVDTSCYMTRRWGVLSYLLRQTKKNESQSNKKKLFDADDLPGRSKFNGKSVRRISNQEEFVTLTPVESDCKRSMTLSSASRATTSSDGSELRTFGETTAEGSSSKVV